MTLPGNRRPDFRIIQDQPKKRGAESIELYKPAEGKNPIRFEEDGSLLMTYHEQGSEHGYQYTSAIMTGYTKVGSFENAEQAWRLFNYKQEGETGKQTIAAHIDTSSPTLMLPTQAGRCPHNCKQCVFAFNAPETRGKRTKNLDETEIAKIIDLSIENAKKAGIDTENLGIAFVGSGDSSKNHHLEKIVKKIITDYPQILRIRFSTVAGKTARTPMEIFADIYQNPEYHGKPVLSLQVSAHSTNEHLRAEHVNFQNPRLHDDNFLEIEEHHLVPLPKVAKLFERMVEAQKNNSNLNGKVRKPSLTFVCNSETVLETQKLLEYGFHPDTTVIQLRPILITHEKEAAALMSKEQFTLIFNSLKQAGFDVVIMPVSPSGLELKEHELDEE